MALLEVREVGVRFGGLQALDDVTLDVVEGQVTGLIGPNGAGKTTLFNVITGLQAPSAGHVVVDGEDVTLSKPHVRARKGIGRTFQRLETFGTLTARENVLVGAEMRRGWSRERFDVGGLADDLIARVGLESVAHEKVDKLPTGTARLVEVARALASKPRVLLLDEPSAGLNEGETTALGELLRDLASSGLAVLLVEHDMSFVMGACHGINVLDFGRIIAKGDPTEIQANPDVRAAYLGSGDRTGGAKGGGAGEAAAEAAGLKADLPVVTVLDDAGASTPPSEPVSGDALVLRDVRAAYGIIDVLHDVNLTMPAGTVFALLGPNGAGKSTTLRIASGLLKPTGGSVHVLGEDVTGKSADAMSRSGVCLIPEGRGVFPNLTVTENLRMATYSGTSFKTVLERAFERFPRLRERRKQVAGTLSGGEQQMLAMARALATDPKVLLLDELSMGLAPLIVEELYDVVKRIAEADVSILIVEQFAHEVLGVADTAAIMLHGKIEFTGEPHQVGDALDRAYLGGSVTA
jgi:branched-chain amino acid transport system ATP-binding protein